MTKAVFQLEPPTCPSCIQKIESTLSKTEGIETATALYHTGKVRTKSNKNNIHENNITEIIENLGYPVVSVKVS